MENTSFKEKIITELGFIICLKSAMLIQKQKKPIFLWI
ncbi:hypothetical protein C815_02030 [Firmicutes bacterium M10-2]|nr:hypothetical protein C815_02030 [Firmicutes bacterium M10-2]